jgi:hypothetical protein
MTKKLEDFFNMESLETDRSESTSENQLPMVNTAQIVDLQSSIKEQLTVAQRIDQALPQVKGLDTEDNDLDDYAQKAMESYDRLMDLGFNVDDRNAGKIFEVASGMMSNAITAKTAKLEKKLKMVSLQLQAARLANSMKDAEPAGDASTELTTDRNAILNLINQNLKKNDK